MGTRDGMSLCIPISVLGEASAICFEGERHKPEELHNLIDFLARYQVRFLHPNRTVAEAYYNLYSDELRDNRMTPADLVHLGYAMAYNVDYFITTDSVLNRYRVPAGFKVKVLHPKDAIKRFL
jgi:predicted nucleic acid-binding protein